MLVIFGFQDSYFRLDFVKSHPWSSPGVPRFHFHTCRARDRMDLRPPSPSATSSKNNRRSLPFCPMHPACARCHMQGVNTKTETFHSVPCNRSDCVNQFGVPVRTRRNSGRPLSPSRIEVIRTNWIPNRELRVCSIYFIQPSASLMRRSFFLLFTGNSESELLVRSPGRHSSAIHHRVALPSIKW